MTEYTVHNECDTYHVTAVLKDGQEQKQDCHLRHESKHGAQTADDTVNRKADDEARKNPLPKLYHERKEDGNRNRHVTPNAAAEGKTPVRENVEEKAE